MVDQSKNNQEAARAWFGKGDSDLRSARALLALDPPESEAVAFHCQQAAEKYLKGLLAYHGDQPPRTHDLSALLDLLISYAQKLEQLRGAAQFLTPFAVEGRYPFVGEPLTEKEAEQAIQHAQNVCNYVKMLISAEPTEGEEG